MLLSYRASHICDGAGFLFENFGPIGEQRDEEAGKPVDTSGKLNSWIDADGPAASSVDLEKDLAIEEQGEKLEPRKIVLPAQLFDVLRRRQHGQDGGNLRIADFEQRAGARRFEDHLVTAPSHICEAR